MKRYRNLKATFSSVRLTNPKVFSFMADSKIYILGCADVGLSSEQLSRLDVSLIASLKHVKKRKKDGRSSLIDLALSRQTSILDYVSGEQSSDLPEPLPPLSSDFPPGIDPGSCMECDLSEFVIPDYAREIGDAFVEVLEEVRGEKYVKCFV